MKVAFAFFLRLFICFVAAKFLVQVTDLDARSYLVALTLILLLNVYLLDYLVFRDRRTSQESPPETPPEEPRR
jgi:hypothetical protein